MASRRLVSPVKRAQPLDLYALTEERLRLPVVGDAGAALVRVTAALVGGSGQSQRALCWGRGVRSLAPPSPSARLGDRDRLEVRAGLAGII
jgi:hypothetical protein